jgi:hypothetical protein
MCQTWLGRKYRFALGMMGARKFITLDGRFWGQKRGFKAENGRF